MGASDALPKKFNSSFIMKIAIWKKLLLGACLGIGAVPLSAQNYSVNWCNVAGGGGTGSNGPYTLSATLGQPEAGGVLTGGSYSLTVGFWSILATPAGTNTNCYPAAPCLQNWWTGNGTLYDSEGGDTAFWAPSTPANNNGFTAGQNGQEAFFFNGTDFLETTQSNTSPQNFTLEGWFDTTTTNGGGLIGFNLSQGGNGSMYDRMIYMGKDGLLYFGVWLNGQPLTVHSTAAYNDGHWHNVAATFSSSGGESLYVDGSLVAQNAQATTAENYTGYWRIGSAPINWNGANWPDAPVNTNFSGALQNVIVSCQPLSAQQVEGLYVAGPLGNCPCGPLQIVSAPYPVPVCSQPGTNFPCGPMPDMTRQVVVAPGGGPVTITQWPAAGTPVCPGSSTTASFYVENACGDVVYTNVPIVVESCANPCLVYVCPSNMIIPTCSNEATVCFPPITVYDPCCSNYTYSYSQPSCSLFQAGTTPVTLTVSDSCGNSNSCAFTVTVIQAEPPTITILTNTIVLSNACANGCGWFSGSQTTSYTNTNVSPPIECITWSCGDPQLAPIFTVCGPVGTFGIGASELPSASCMGVICGTSNEVIVPVTNICGLTEYITNKISVEQLCQGDCLTLTCPVTNIIVRTCSNCAPVFFPPLCSTSTCCDGYTAFYFNPPSGTCFPLGTSNVTGYYFTFCGGATNTVSFNVTVTNDTSPPEIISNPAVVSICPGVTTTGRLVVDSGTADFSGTFGAPNSCYQFEEPQAATLLRNIADYLTAGKGNHILIYSMFLGPNHEGISEQVVRDALSGYIVKFVDGETGPLQTACQGVVLGTDEGLPTNYLNLGEMGAPPEGNLLNYDAVLLGPFNFGPVDYGYVNIAGYGGSKGVSMFPILEQYIGQGGGVYMAVGYGNICSGDVSIPAWNPIVNYFGLALSPTLNTIGSNNRYGPGCGSQTEFPPPNVEPLSVSAGTLAVDPSSPIMAGVPEMIAGGGADISLIGPGDPGYNPAAQVVAWCDGRGLLATSECLFTNGGACGVMTNLAQLIQLADHSPAVVWQSIPPGTPICQNTNVIVYASNQCGVTSNSIPVILGCSPNCLSFNFTNFASNALAANPLQLNGKAAAPVIGAEGTPVLRLTTAMGSEAGSAFLPVQLGDNLSFCTAFAFQITNGGSGDAGADGIVFVLAAAGTDVNLLGSGGGGCGYMGIPSSVGIKFDTYKDGAGSFPQDSDPNGNFVAVYTDGSVDTAGYVPYSPSNPAIEAQYYTPPTSMKNGDIWYAWIDYHGDKSEMELRLSDGINVRPASPQLIQNISLDNLSILGLGTQLYAGFTSATGEQYDDHDILSWQFSSSCSNACLSIQCSNLVVTTCSNCATVPFTATAIDTCCTNVDLLYIPASNTCFLANTTNTVQVVAFDSCNDTAVTNFFTVTVLPGNCGGSNCLSLAGPSNITVTTCSNCTTVPFTFTAIDTCCTNVILQYYPPSNTCFLANTTNTVQVVAFDICNDTALTNFFTVAVLSCQTNNECACIGSNVVTELESYATIYNFTGTTDGFHPIAGLVMSNTTLYGTSFYAGVGDGYAGYGTVFAVQTNGSDFAPIYKFSGGSDGAFPFAGLVLSGATLYGTTAGGGSAQAFSGHGTIYKVNINGSGFLPLHTFSGGSDGAFPEGALLLNNGILYGTAASGGSGSHGVVFSMNIDGSGFVPLYPFTGGNDGANPGAALILSGTTLYGTASAGGSGGYGTVFSMNIDGSGFVPLYPFSGGSDGAFPESTLVLAGSTLYGTAAYGGSADYFYGNGTVFALNTNSTGFTVLHTFAGSPGDGAVPTAGLVLAGNTLFGTTTNGGLAGGLGGLGTVFSLNTNGAGYETLHFFAGSPNDGASPAAGLLLAGDTLYGTATLAGTSGYAGTVFALTLTNIATNCLQVQCPGDIVTNSCTNVQVFYAPSVTDLGCTNPTVLCTPPSGTPFAPNSTNTVTCSVTDCCGNSNGCTFTVTVLCSTNTNCCPNCVQPYPDSYTVTVFPGSNYLADDLCQGANSTVAGVLTNLPNGTQIYLWNEADQKFNPPDTYTVAEGWSKGGTEPLSPGEGFLLVSFTNNTYALSIGGCEPQCPGPCSPASGANETSLVGGSGVTTSAYSNLFSCPPVCGTEVKIWDPANQMFTTYSYVNDAWSPSAPVLPIGYSELVTVDTSAPMINCPGEMTVLSCTPTNIYFTVTANSAFCGALTPTCSPSSGSLFDLGPTTVTATATDCCGRSTNCSFIVEVLCTPILTLTNGNQTSSYGTSPTTLGGKITSTGAGSPAVGETVTVTINGNAQTTSISDSNGDFSISYNSAALPASATPYTITYSYGGDAFLAPATNSDTTLTVIPATPVVTWSNPAPISYVTPLSSVQLNATANVPGTFSYSPPFGAVLPIGTNTLTVLFTPSDTNDYTSATGSATVVVSSTTQYLPVYQVTQAGATLAQASNLAVVLNLPLARVGWSNGQVSFIDPTNFMAIPTISVTDTNSPVISSLIAGTKNPYPSNPISVQALDIAALTNMPVFDTNDALIAASNAFAAAGLLPQYGTPVPGHHVFSIFTTNTDNGVTSACQYLDTLVNYNFWIPGESNSYPLIGAGAKAQVAYGGHSNVTRLLYTAPTLAAGPSVQIITPTVASNRAASILPSNAIISLQLVYMAPPLIPQPTPPCYECPPTPWNPTNLLPYYAFSGTIPSNSVTGPLNTISTSIAFIPATDDTNYVPSISVSASQVGTQVTASVIPTGGLPPYTYVWSASGSTIATNNVPSISYTPVSRILPPSLAIVADPASDSITVSWPYRSTGYILESTSNLASRAWMPVTNLVQTNAGSNGFNLVTMANRGDLFLRLGLVSNTVPASESLSVTVIDANGVSVRSNLVLNVQAVPISLASPSDPDYAIEDPYNSFDAGIFNVVMTGSSGRGSTSFFRSGANSLPGDFIEPNTPGSIQEITPRSTAPSSFGLTPMAASADVNGVDTANFLLYESTFGTPTSISFSWPGPFDPEGYIASTWNELSVPSTPLQPGSPYQADFNFWVDPFFGFSLGNEDYSKLNLSWGPEGKGILDWLVLDAPYVLQFDAGDFLNFPTPSHPYGNNGANGAYYAFWQRWGPACNGLHSILGWDNQNESGVGTPAALADYMLGSTAEAYTVLGYVPYSIQPQTILQSWFAGVEGVKDSGQLNPPIDGGYGPNPANATLQGSVPVAMGPAGPQDPMTGLPVMDLWDYYPGFGNMGVDISRSQVSGYWFAYTQYNMVNATIFPDSP
jgi:uncharacterized repeat protein (TIGR03803 family)